MVKALQKAGLEFDRQEGDHVVLVKPGMARPVVVPLYDELPDFVVSNNLRTAGISRKAYLELLGKRRKKRKPKD